MMSKAFLNRYWIPGTMNLSKALSRRQVLKGMGAAIGLPFLEAMVPRTLRMPAAAPKRAAFLFMPNGIHPEKWTPEAMGSNFKLTPILSPLQPVKDDLLILTNLMNQNSDTREDGHYTKTANFLTSMRITKTTGANINSGGTSIDQLMADRSPNATIFPSLAYGIDRITSGADGAVGFTRLYGSAISWKTATQPRAKEIDPRMAFDRLFRSFIPGKPVPDEPAWRSSVLDLVMEDTKSLQKSLGAADQNKLAEYLAAIRSIERRIESHEKIEEFKDHITPAMLQELSNMDNRIDEYVEYHAGIDVTEKTRLMLDIIVLAFWSDATRFATFMFGNSVSNRNFSFLDGVYGGFHSNSHHKNDERLLDQYERINKWHIEQYAYLLNRLKNIPEGDGTLLDNSTIMFGSGLRDGNRHSPVNLPIVLAGKAGGQLQTGHHLKFDEKTPLANLYQSLLHVWGINDVEFGDSTGELKSIYA